MYFSFDSIDETRPRGGKRPTRLVLEAGIKQYPSATQLSKHFKVHLTTVYKWLRHYGIDLPNGNSEAAQRKAAAASPWRDMNHDGKYDPKSNRE